MKYLGVAQINSRLSPIPLQCLQNNLCSPLYTTSGLTSFRQLPKFPETHVFSYRNTNFNKGTQAKLHAAHIVSRRELIPRIILNSKANFKQAPQEEPSLSNRYVRGTLCFLSQVEWSARDPDSKEGRISLQWLQFNLVFPLTR